ncbi:MAG: VWA domain-containing protein [Verrucomicrobia bacterium]|nr:VWA domain-containing protein [Verrucomicrobiota bacterium]
MKKSKWAGLLLAAASLLQLGQPQIADAAGLLVADGGFGGVLEIKEHDVNVTINNGVAVTKVTQIFHNTESRQVEALYTFPVPKGASVANFSMWINGKEMVGEVLEKKKAREIYESYKAKRIDPGILEQVDYKTFEMRIFPIGAQADQKVQITYYQELEFDHDWATYIYPLATTTRREVDSRTTGKFAFSLETKSAVPINAMESPSHGNDIVIAKHDPHLFQASLETKSGSLAKDIVIGYHLSRAQTGLDLITSKVDGEDGYFCLTMTAGDDLAKLDDGMDYVFVLDISGSMADDGKLLVSKDSIGAFINELSEKDRFEVMTFNVQANVAFRELRDANDTAKTAASQFLATQRARGGTVLNPAMNTAYKYAAADRPLNVVILSDGMTETGERQTLLNLIKQRPRNARVFCIGVGNEVNKPLLEQMAQDSGGLASFISRGDDFTRQAKAFRRKLTRPAATDLQIDFGGIQVSDVQPETLPNLYHGSPVRIYGRYKGGAEAKVSVRGSVNGIEFKQTANLNFPKKDDSNPEIDRMWAWHKVDALLKQADRNGNRAAVVDEVIRLGEGYSIVTEYTSFLVLENDNEYKRWKIARTNLLRNDRDRNAQVARQKNLDAIRNKAMADIGPQEQPVANPQTSAQPGSQRFTPQAQQPVQEVASSRNSGQSHNFNFGGGGGSGPVGPLFIPLLWWMRRLKNKKV